jgi:hypothetical protein
LNPTLSSFVADGTFPACSGPTAVFRCRWSGGDFGGGPFASPENLIATVDSNSIGGGAHFNVTGATTFGTAGSVNLFKNPDATAADFRYPLLSSDGRDRSGHPIRGLGLWNLDSRLGKETSFHERFKIEISADFFNIFKSP